jgi:hypothetical protein
MFFRNIGLSYHCTRYSAEDGTPHRHCREKLRFVGLHQTYILFYFMCQVCSSEEPFLTKSVKFEFLVCCELYCTDMNLN